MTGTWTEEDIAAFVDGALEGPERDRVARLIANDPEALAAADQIRESNALLREAFAAPLSEPVPRHMSAQFDARNVVTPFRSRRAAWAPAALAASVALVIGAIGGALVEPRLAGPAVERMTLAVGSAPQTIARALDAAPSGVLEAGVRPIASFPIDGGRYCREFELQEDEDAAPAAFGLACATREGWRIVVAADIAADATGASNGFAPASGAALDAALPVLDALGAGPALDAEAERRRIADGWR